MSASQVTVFVLIVAAFALGWWGYGWRHGDRRKRDPASPPSGPTAAQAPTATAVAELDTALGALVTASQAALSVWQSLGSSPAPPLALAAQAFAAFERARADLLSFELDAAAPPVTRAALGRARRAADRLAEGLGPLTAGEPLELDRERALVAAERALSAVRYALLAGAPR